MSDHHGAPETEKLPENFEDLFEGERISAEMLQGKDVTLIISAVKKEGLENDDGEIKNKGVLHFKKTKKTLILNKTNGLCIKAMFGDKVQKWVGHKVTFCPEKDKYMGKIVPCVRIKGSPDIDGDMEITIKHPKRKAVKRILKCTKKPDREPGQEG